MHQANSSCAAFLCWKKPGKFGLDDGGNPVHNEDLPSGKLLGLIEIAIVSSRNRFGCNSETDDACWARNNPMALRYNAF